MGTSKETITADDETAVAYDAYESMVARYKVGDMTVSGDDVEKSYSHYLLLHYRFDDFSYPPLPRMFLKDRESTGICAHGDEVNGFVCFLVCLTIIVAGAALILIPLIGIGESFSRLNILQTMQMFARL